MREPSSVDDYSICLDPVLCNEMKYEEKIMKWGYMRVIEIKVFILHKRGKFLYCSNIYTDLFTFVILVQLQVLQFIIYLIILANQNV